LVKTKTSVGFFGSANKQIAVLPNEIRRKIHLGPEFAALPFGQTRFRPRQNIAPLRHPNKSKNPVNVAQNPFLLSHHFPAFSKGSDPF